MLKKVGANEAENGNDAAIINWEKEIKN